MTGVRRYREKSKSTAVSPVEAPQSSRPVECVPHGAVVMVDGFGEAGSRVELIHALIDQGARDLTIVSNNCGSGEVGLAALFKSGRVRRVICSFPKTTNSTVFPELYRAGKCELELTPQGTLAERIRAALVIPNGAYVNLGIDILELVASFVPEGRTVISHTENGMIGMGPEGNRFKVAISTAQAVLGAGRQCGWACGAAEAQPVGPVPIPRCTVRWGHATPYG